MAKGIEEVKISFFHFSVSFLSSSFYFLFFVGGEGGLDSEISFVGTAGWSKESY